GDHPLSSLGTSSTNGGTVSVERWSWIGIAALGVVLAVVAWFAYPGPQPAEQPRAREYRDYDVCLLTGDQGMAEPETKQVWDGLQQVSLQTKVRVSFLEVSGEQTEARAAQFVATQVQQRCGIIVAVGRHQVAAATAAAARYPDVRFVAINGTAAGPNLFNVSAGDSAPRVASLVPAR
ncbi:BMP family ABC transporter substrate-binding protein, partial [Allorhizocola rhizosphaerae]|uniref:BMP family ABC transporter substrate-binding protein n=1 Tax=Allorhizocola rhizosphaerae TaxID=1872709 RepID=UPI001B8C3845